MLANQNANWLFDYTKVSLMITIGTLTGQEKEQRSLDLNTAKCMLGLLLGKTWPLFPVFNQFLEVSTISLRSIFCFLLNG